MSAISWEAFSIAPWPAGLLDMPEATVADMPEAAAADTPEAAVTDMAVGALLLVCSWSSVSRLKRFGPAPDSALNLASLRARIT
jgi:hypothetical protein